MVAAAAIRDCGFVELDHPAYSPDLATSDFFLFKNLKHHLRGKRFGDNSEVKDEIKSYFESNNQSWFSEGICLLKMRYEKCIDIGGGYVKK